MTIKNVKADKKIFRCRSISTRSRSPHSFTNSVKFELKITYDPVCSSVIISSCTSNAPIGAALNSICISLFSVIFSLIQVSCQHFHPLGLNSPYRYFFFRRRNIPILFSHPRIVPAWSCLI